MGVIHKQRGQLKGRGLNQMTILLHKPYFLNVTTKGEGGPEIHKNLTTLFMDDPKDRRTCHFFHPQILLWVFLVRFF